MKKNTFLTIRVSSYKKAAKKPMDVTEDVIRNYAIQNDLADVKVFAESVNEVSARLSQSVGD